MMTVACFIFLKSFVVFLSERTLYQTEILYVSMDSMTEVYTRGKMSAVVNTSQLSQS